MSFYEQEITDIYNGYEIRHGIIKGNDTVFLVKTGLNGSIYGYNDKYCRISERVHSKYGYTIIISSNPYDGYGGIRFGFTKDHLDKSINIARKLGGKQVFLFGHSNGALMSLLHAYKYPEIKKMLLVNTPLHLSNISTVNKKAELYKDLKLVYGSQDDFSFLQKGLKRKPIVIEGEDHHFSKGIYNFEDLPFEYLL